MIDVVRAPAFLTVQDLGRPGHRAHGVPAGGAMDPWALRTANVLVGNPEGAAGLEWAVGGGVLRFECEALVAIAGATAGVHLGGREALPLTTLRARPGDELALTGDHRSPQWGDDARFLYVAVGGGIAVPEVLGGRGTCLAARFGGLDGRFVRTGDRIPVGPPPPFAPRPGFHCPADLAPPGADLLFRIVPGPQARMLDAEGWNALTGSAFEISAAADRTGFRLDGPRLRMPPAPTIPSEPCCPGTLQLPPGGRLMVLMADAPTVGGYPKPAVVASADIGRLAQYPAGFPLRFTRITIDEAQHLHRRERIRLHTLRSMAWAATGGR